MKKIIQLKVKERLLLNDVEEDMKSARNSMDYYLVQFGKKNEFIKIAFSRDNTYTIGYNFINYEFMARTNVMLRQWTKVNIGKLSGWLTDWVNRLNR